MSVLSNRITRPFPRRLLTCLALPSPLFALACGSADFEKDTPPDVSVGTDGDYGLPPCNGRAVDGGASGSGVDGGSGIDTGSGIGHRVQLKPASGSGTEGSSGTASGSGVSDGASSGGRCIDENGNIVTMGGDGDGDGDVSGDGDGDAGFNCNEKTFTYTGEADEVWVSGTFTTPEWATTVDEGALPLLDQGDGTWTLTTDIVEGIHEYKVVLNGSSEMPEWIADPANPSQVDDTVGGFNSSLSVCRQECGDLEAFDWRDTFMYFAMIDRFNDSDGMADEISGATDNGDASGQYEGGDIQGLTDKVAYLEDLGVSTIWISAPYDNRDSLGIGMNDTNMYTGYHGYWPKPANIDYSDPDNPAPVPLVEDRVGSAAELKAFIEAAHTTTTKNGHEMKVLFDYVMNHVDDESGLYAAHPEWFFEEGDGPVLCGGSNNYWDDAYYGTRCAFTDYLPAFDFDNAEARAWSVNDAVWWAKEFGVDGYRLDAIKHVPLNWLTDLRERITAEDLDQTGDRFYLVGETFSYDDRALLKSFVDPATMLDGQFDFPFKKQLCEGVFAEGGDIGAFADWMDGNDGYYGPGSIMTTWIGNHDIPRAIHFASRQITSCTEGSHTGNGWAAASYPQPADPEPYERLAVAYAVMFTNAGIPLIYYGDEIGLAGGGDPDNRRMMPWTAGATNAHQDALRDRLKSLAEIRGEHPVLSRGNRSTQAKTADTWVYTMSGCEEATLTVAINKSDSSQDVAVPAGTNLETGEEVAAGTLPLGPRDFIIIQ